MDLCAHRCLGDTENTEPRRSVDTYNLIPGAFFLFSDCAFKKSAPGLYGSCPAPFLGLIRRLAADGVFLPSVIILSYLTEPTPDSFTKHLAFACQMLDAVGSSNGEQDPRAGCYDQDRGSSLAKRESERKMEKRKKGGPEICAFSSRARYTVARWDIEGISSKLIGHGCVYQLNVYRHLSQNLLRQRYHPLYMGTGLPPPGSILHLPSETPEYILTAR